VNWAPDIRRINVEFLLSKKLVVGEQLQKFLFPLLNGSSTHTPASQRHHGSRFVFVTLGGHWDSVSSATFYRFTFLSLRRFTCLRLLTSQPPTASLAYGVNMMRAKCMLSFSSVSCECKNICALETFLLR